jgi:hypothetical protein
MKPFNNRVSLHIQSLDLSKTDREDHPHMAVLIPVSPFLFGGFSSFLRPSCPINNVSDGIPAA